MTRPKMKKWECDCWRYDFARPTQMLDVVVIVYATTRHAARQKLIDAGYRPYCGPTELRA